MGERQPGGSHRLLHAIPLLCSGGSGPEDIDATGKILLPQSALHVLLAKLPEMPSTLLLRLSHEGSSAYCGVAEFLEDAEMSALLTRVAGQAVRSDELPRFFRGGPLAVCFVPRWVNPNPNPNPNAIPNPNPNPNANPNPNPNPNPNRHEQAREDPAHRPLPRGARHPQP